MYVTWVEPSGRDTVPRVPETPDASAGWVPADTTSGGHTTAHCPVQLVEVGVSVVK